MPLRASHNFAVPQAARLGSTGAACVQTWFSVLVCMSRGVYPAETAKQLSLLTGFRECGMRFPAALCWTDLLARRPSPFLYSR